MDLILPDLLSTITLSMTVLFRSRISASKYLLLSDIPNGQASARYRRRYDNARLLGRRHGLLPRTAHRRAKYGP